MIRNHFTTRLFRSALLLAVVASGILTLIGSGGGGGGGGDTVTSYSLLPYYDFRIAGVDDPTDSWPMGITAEFTTDAITHELRVDPQSVVGGFSCDPVTEECQLANIDTTTHVAISDLSATLFGDFSIDVIEQLIFLSDAVPVDGRIQIAQAGGFGFVTVDVTTCTGGVAGVEIIDNGTSRGCFTWAQFDGLLETSSETSERVSRLAYGVLELLLDMSNMTALNSFDLMENDMASLGNIPLECDSFSSAGVSPPDEFSAWDLGNALFHFVDENADLEQTPGDSYGYIFNFCWQNDPTDNIDELYHGVVDLISLTEVVNASDVLIRIGYEGSTNGKTGGVFFDYFVMDETESDSILGTSSIVSRTVLNGGMSVVFSAP